MQPQCCLTITYPIEAATFDWLGNIKPFSLSVTILASATQALCPLERTDVTWK